MTKTHCEICNRNFKNEEALEMHNNALHVQKKTEPTSKPKSKATVVWALLIVVVLVGGFFLVSAAISPGKYDEFAKCLTEKGAKMYGAYWCPHCQEQKKIFGKSWKYVEYIECSLPNAAGQTEECDNAGIENYPTWEFADKSKNNGVLTLASLSQKTGCSPPE